MAVDLAHEEDTAFIDAPWPNLVAWLCFTMVSFVTAINVSRHLLNYSRPDLQTHIVRIVSVAPIYAFSAALSLSMHEQAAFFIQSARDVWEAVVIYSFMTLIVQYMGGEHLCLTSISENEGSVPHLFPLNLCLDPVPMASMIRATKIGALQFVVVKPVVAIISIVAYACGVYENPNYEWTLFVVYNISYSVALYALGLIYFAAHEHQALQSKRPLLKFLSVKMIVFLTFWQALLLPHLPLSGSSGRWENFILAIEMAVFCLLMNAAFSWREFHSGLPDSGCAGGAPTYPKQIDFPSVDLIDIGQEPVTQPSATGQPSATDQPTSKMGAMESSGTVMHNATRAFNPRDVLDDASRNFSRRYQKHVLIECAQEYELKARDCRKQVDLLDDIVVENTGDGPPAAVNKAGSSPVRTFRARTYLLGRSLGATCKGGRELEHCKLDSSAVKIGNSIEEDIAGRDSNRPQELEQSSVCCLSACQGSGADEAAPSGSRDELPLQNAAQLGCQTNAAGTGNHIIKGGEATSSVAIPTGSRVQDPFA